MIYSFIIYTDQKIDYVYFYQEITKQWDPQFPLNKVRELEEEGFIHSGNDGVFVLPQAVDKQKVYEFLIEKGYKYGFTGKDALQKEFTENVYYAPKNRKKK